MGILSMFKKGNYFDKSITAKCDYCSFGKRAKDGNKIICEHRGLVDPGNSCGKFNYSPLKRIPVKQLNFVGSLADDEIYIESAGDRAEKEAAKRAEEEKKKPKKAPVPETAPAPAKSAPEEAPASETSDQPVAASEEAPADAVSEEAPASDVTEQNAPTEAPENKTDSSEVTE